MGFFIYYLK